MRTQTVRWFPVSLALAAAMNLVSGCGGAPSRCELPFDPGHCLASFDVYAFVDGQYVPRTYGGCEGNANRFKTLEDCQSACANGE